MTQADQIAARARAAFPAEPVPPAAELSNDHCEECADVSKAFGARAWTDVALGDLVQKETALLTATAWRYYLPAIITLCVQNPEALDLLPEFTVYQLEPPKAGEEDAWFSERSGGFSKAQREVIIDYLDWYREREESEGAGWQGEPPQNVYRALKYWRSEA